MITNINSFKSMEQFFNTSWFVANITALYIGLKAKLTILQVLILDNITFIDISLVKDIAVIIGVISSIIFAGYNLSKWYHQILETKKLRKENHVEKLFKFVEDNKIDE